MQDLQVGKSPAFDAHVLGHDRQALRFDLADMASAQRMWIAHPAASGAVEERWEDEAVAVTIGTDQQHGAADRLQPHRALAAQIAQMLAAAVGPGVQIETVLPVSANAIRLHDIAIQRGELLDDVAGILDDVGIEPQHPILVA